MEEPIDIYVNNKFSFDNIKYKDKYTLGNKIDRKLSISNDNDISYSVSKSIINDIIDKIESLSLNSNKFTLGDFKERLGNLQIVTKNDYYQLNINDKKYYGNIINDQLFINGSNQLLWEDKAYNLLRKIMKYKEIIIAVDYEYVKNGVKKPTKKYSIVNIDNLKHLEDISAYELILNYDLPYTYNLYLDIDIILNSNNIDNEINKIDEIITNLLNDTIQVCKENLFYEIDKSKILIASSSGKVNDKYKYSLHILLGIYTENLIKLYNIFTYLNCKVFQKYKYNNTEIVDGSVYVKNIQKSHQLRLFNQSKNNNRKLIAYRLNDFGFSNNILDYLVVNINKESKIINSQKVDELLSYMYKSRNFDKSLSNTEKNELIILNLPNFKDYSKLSYNDCLKMYLEYDNIYEALVNIFLICIPNTIKKQQNFKAWFKILVCVKYIGFKYFNNSNHFKEHFLKFTLNSYNKYKNVKRQEEYEKNHSIKCIQIWDYVNIEEYKECVGLPTLQNIALFYDHEITLKVQFSNIFKYFFSISAKENGYDEYIINDINEKVNFKKHYMYDTIVTDVNVGEGKTEAFINLFIEQYRKNHIEFGVIFSNRIIYCNELLPKINEFLHNKHIKPFISYLEINEMIQNKHKINIRNYSGIIISPESLAKHYDLFKSSLKKNKYISFLDESETLMKCIFGNTNKNINKTSDIINKIWKKSLINIIVDAYMTRRSIYFINKLNAENNKTKHLYIHAKNRNLYPKTFNIVGEAYTKYEKILFDEVLAVYIIESLKSNDNIVSFVESASLIDKIKNCLVQYGLNDETDFLILSNKEKLKDVNKYILNLNSFFNDKSKFENIKIWLYNSSLINGASILAKNFNKGIMCIDNFGNCKDTITANDNLNAIARSRLTNDIDVFMKLSSCRHKLIEHHSLDLKVIENLNFNYNASKSIYTDYTKIKQYYNHSEKIMNSVNEYNRCMQEVINKNYVIERNIIHDKMIFIEKINNIIDIANIVFTINKTDYDEYYDNGLLISANFIIDLHNQMNNLNALFNNFNKIFKKEVFISLALLKGNFISNDKNITLQYNNNKAKKVNKSKNINEEVDEEENSNSIIALSYEDYLKNKETYNFGLVEIPMSVKDNHISFLEKKLRKYFSFNDDRYEDFKAIVYNNSSMEYIVEKLIATKKNKLYNDFNPICINTLLKLFSSVNKEIETLSDLIFCIDRLDNITINNHDLFINNFENANIWRKMNHQDIIYLRGDQYDKSYCFIRDCNLILSDFGLKFVKEIQYNHIGEEIKRHRKKINGKLVDYIEYSLQPIKGNTQYETSYKSHNGDIKNVKMGVFEIIKYFKNIEYDFIEDD